ncbi:hypothetical protein PGVV14_0001B [Preplasmiviricota sp. Gezel-14T]|nr:hypothetical protein PGVV14_0001B [Preplasmiviricota sp. Gezel-14T]
MPILDKYLFIPVRSPMEQSPDCVKFDNYRCICSDYPISFVSIRGHKKCIKHKEFIKKKFGEQYL